MIGSGFGSGRPWLPSRAWPATEPSADVIVEGDVVNRLREGDGFGEVALLHDVPRPATVRATESGAVWALDQAEFLETVTGQPRAPREPAEGSQRGGSGVGW